MDNQPANPKQALLERLQQANNILVTVSRDPSVDELASCLGLTLWLNKAGKHATAVFSGEVPSTLEFLQPAETLEKNTDSLRDFIISLDKSKADKLRYKVEDEVVKIFITPYRTSLSADDLEYSQGDFNVEMVVALGVANQEDLDTAITAHGRILHDATVATITNGQPSELGSINWNDAQSSSLSELVVELGDAISKKELDGQIATALLTGVVAETERFSNDKTTPQTMSVSAELMSAGANQQLVASQLEPQPIPNADNSQAATDSSNDDQSEDKPDGELDIDHEEVSEELPPPVEPPAEDEPAGETPAEEQPPAEEPAPEPETPEITDVKETASDAENHIPMPADNAAPEADNHSSKLVTEPPTMGGTLTANSRPDDIMLEPSSDALTAGAAQAPHSLISHDDDQPTPPVPPQPPTLPDEPAFVPPAPAAPDWMPPQPWLNDQPAAGQPQPPLASDDQDDQTLTEIEQSVDSPHLGQPPAGLDSARDEVMKAINAMPEANPEPVQALNASPIDLNSPTPPPAGGPDVEMPLPPPAFANTQFNPGSFDITNDVKDAQQPAPTEVDPDLTTPVEQPFSLPLPDPLAPPAANPLPTAQSDEDPNAPPPVPPPLMPPGFPPAP